MDGTAVILTNGLLSHYKAKTAHGLVRGTERYEILGVIDHEHAGKDAGEVLDGVNRNIPVYASLKACLATTTRKIDFMIVGVATKGGLLPEEMRPLLNEALQNGISLVSGLHQFLADMPDMRELASLHNARLIDVRKPKPFSELHFWNGKITSVKCPKIAVLGTDCNMGKRTTARFLKEASAMAGLRAEMIYTGQTGWMQGGKYGFIFDSTLNDFISGELEHAMVTCYQEVKPDIIFMEGQSSLRNPSGPCGSEFLISGDADGVVLQHAPARESFHGCQGYKRKMPSLEDEINLIKMYGADTIAITVNTKGMSLAHAREYQHQQESQLGIPVILPLEDGVSRLTLLLGKYIENFRAH